MKEETKYINNILKNYVVKLGIEYTENYFIVRDINDELNCQTISDAIRKIHNYNDMTLNVVKYKKWSQLPINLQKIKNMLY